MMEQANDSNTAAAPPAGRPHRLRSRRLRLGLAALCLAVLSALGLSASRPAIAAPSSTITVNALQYNADGTTGAALANFTYIVNVDNSGDVTSTDPLQRPSFHPTESNSPVVAEGDQSSPTVTLPDGRYLISIRSPGHRLWGKLIKLPADAGAVNIALRSTPAPLGKLVVQVFADNGYTNSAPDEGEAGVEGVGNMAGFKVTLTEQTGTQVTVDYNNQPLCGGDCLTGPDDDTVRRRQPAGVRRGRQQRHGPRWRGRLGRPGPRHVVLVRLRRREHAFCRARHGDDHGPVVELGRLAAVRPARARPE
jgi:hypothetical protein